MAAFNVTAEDSSPLISYSPVGAWTDSPSNDTGAPVCTGIWFFGAKRPDYGTYTISIDGQSTPGNAQFQTAAFQQLLGGQSGLVDGPHAAVFTNTGLNSAIDLDSIVFETRIGSADATITDTTTDDISPSITYLPTSGDWIFNNLRGSFNDTLHFTQTGGAQAQLTFNGDAVAIYGTVFPDHANYTVSVDGHTQSFLGGSSGLISNLHIGYFANGLGSDLHNLTLTANPEQIGQENTGMVAFSASTSTSFNNTTSNGNGGKNTPLSTSGMPQSNQENANNNAAQGQTPSHSSRGPNAAVIGGLVSGIFILLLLIALAIVLIRRRRTIRRDHPPKLSVLSPMTPSLPMQTPPALGSSPQTPTGSKQWRRKGFARSLGTVPNHNPFNDARLKMPSVPEMSVVRDSYDDGRAGDLQIQSSAVSRILRLRS
ncbi:hypothetical protein B0F90DRAFT_1700534 [Multifurca ochricompacta]|uniref:Uncharacterized protein n=1 Tax=Multifurca ochricompacta TaxID=376703 RepID=A0AAD4QR39_9AGAM|nr:hypothetical protein B0F90DRAFT_1700534 [Multifurca ochricompacta]